MKRLFFVLFLIILLSSVIIGQPRLENTDTNFQNVIEVFKQIVGWFFIILIIIFGIGATVMNLSRKDKKEKQIEP